MRVMDRFSGRFSGRFTQFEQQIERLVEGTFTRLFAGRLHPRDVISRLARAMDDHAIEDSDGRLIAPNHYTVHLHPEDHEVLSAAQPDLRMVLIRAVKDLAHRAAVHIHPDVRVDIKPNDETHPRTVMITAEHHADSVRIATQAFKPLPPPDEQYNMPRSPQLVVQGTRYIPLDRPVMNIGRRADNHIILDDLRVSRSHAQIRLRFGKFTLFDLGSRGGTFVNSQRVTEAILKPGDVISLAGVLLVYVEDDASTDGIRATKTDTNIRPPSRETPES
jgi:hypothetical protein